MQCSLQSLNDCERSPNRTNLRVNFSEKGEAVKERREKFLTAKYGSHQMSLIRKRLAVEMWLYDELQKLFDPPVIVNAQQNQFEHRFVNFGFICLVWSHRCGHWRNPWYGFRWQQNKPLASKLCNEFFWIFYALIYIFVHNSGCSVIARGPNKTYRYAIQSIFFIINIKFK